jgi:hypothetical protein
MFLTHIIELANMVETPVTTRSIFVYQVSIFAILQIWAIMAFDIALYQMVTLYETPFEWFAWVSLLFLTIMPVLGLLGWKLKNQIQYHKVDWEYRVREVSAAEFAQMIKAYNAGYRSIIAIVDSKLMTLAIACFIGALFLPFPLMRTNPLVISLTPIVIAVFLVLFGIFFTYFIFRLSSNPASSEFPTHNPRLLRNSVGLLTHLPGIFWAGVRTTLGEAGGYYTIQKPYPVARIEGIEGAARLDCFTDEKGLLSEVIALFETESSEESKIIDKTQAPITALDIVKLIKRVLEEYINTRGGEDLLEDALGEVKAYLIIHDKVAEVKNSSDGLISSYDKGPAAEERT